MFKISKNEPPFFTVAKSKVSLPLVSSAWESTEIESIRPKLREHILLYEQNLLCVYCEKEIDDNPKNSNIDHFRLKAGHLFPQRTLDYKNLVVSCNAKGRCSSYKDKHIKSKSDYEKIVNPVDENPDEYFDYLLTGEIVALSASAKAEFTIDIFNLGRRESDNLTQTRKQITEALIYCNNLSLDEIYSEFGNEYHSFIKIIYNKIQEQ